MSVAEWIEPVAAGSPDEALPRLYRDHYADLVRFAYLLSGDGEIAKDVAQEAFVRCWQSWTKIRDKAVIPAWLRGTVVNLSRMSWRRRLLEIRKTPAARLDEEWMDTGRLELRTALRSLPVRQRACVVLRYYEDQSEQATAAILGVSVGTVKSQTHKALQKLRSQLSEEDS